VELVLTALLAYLGIGAACLVRAATRGAGAGTLLALGLCCVFLGPLGWLVSALYESHEYDQSRRVRNATAEAAARNRQGRERKTANELAEIRRHEREVWDAAFERTREIAVADAEVLADRNKMREAAEAKDKRSAELRATWQARQAELDEARAKSKVL
jgi:hypothetical protein